MMANIFMIHKMKRKIIAILLILSLFILSACAKEPPVIKIERTTKSPERVTETTQEITYEYSKESIEFYRDGQTIKGDLYVPVKEGPLKLVILCHGLGGTRASVEDYAEAYAEKGIAACCFDFCGGGAMSESTGDMLSMSILTEAADLQFVFDQLKIDARFDPETIYLWGMSQGGIVATYVAANAPDVAGLVLLCPAFMIPETVSELFPRGKNIPETYHYIGVTLGKKYAEDALKVDIYDLMQNYEGNVIIFHGTDDHIVLLKYSEKAAGTFPHASLYKVPGADHIFYDSDRETVIKQGVAFVLNH